MAEVEAEAAEAAKNSPLPDTLVTGGESGETEAESGSLSVGSGGEWEEVERGERQKGGRGGEWVECGEVVKSGKGRDVESGEEWGEAESGISYVGQKRPAIPLQYPCNTLALI